MASSALQRITLKGFKSIREMDLEFRPLNVLIGANGAGKSNLVSFFKMLNEMIGGRLQEYIAGVGRAHSVLHFGPKVTPQLEARLEFKVSDGVDTYNMRLFHAAGDSLVFAEENFSFHRSGFSTAREISLGAGHVESHLIDDAYRNDSSVKFIRLLLSDCRVYHFHDTSLSAAVRQYGYVGDNRWLMPDAANLAAFLFGLRNESDGIYQQIVSTIQLIAPFFADFDLEPASPNRRDVILNWRHKDSDQVFGPHQLSDGTLRALCLVTLLLQPNLPDLIIVDEPELGLHPSALGVIASLIKRASHHAQVLISTQSSSFLDNFEPEDVIVADLKGRESKFSRPDEGALQSWLQDYSIGQVWEKNVIGGGPY
jgi:predicted ATPase